MKRTNCLFLLLILLSAPAGAEIEKFAQTCEQKMCFYWWPKLPSLKGWHQDKEYSFKYSANAQAPDGYTFDNAESVIYATAIYKPRMPETKTLQAFIENDKKKFSEDETITITETETLQTGDGKNMNSYDFFPKEKGNWERVSYGEEGNFYLVFTVSSRSQNGYQKALESYRRFIHGYKEKRS